MIGVILAFAVQAEPVAGAASRAPAPLEGTWVVGVEIDTVHARVEPRAHRLVGTLRLNASYPPPLDSMTFSGDVLAEIHGVFKLDFERFWGVWPTDVVTIRLNFRTATPARSYINPDGRLCSAP